jgi:hypothetical protein
MIDLSPKIGASLAPECRARVEILPGTSIADYRRSGRPKPDLVLVCDVIHHVPPPDRAGFFADVRDLVEGHAASLVVKDVEPGSFRATLSFLADRYVSGDKKVKLVGAEEMVSLVRAAFPAASYERTRLLDVDRPNYCLVFAVGRRTPERVS